MSPHDSTAADAARREKRLGLIYAVAAYGAWGVFPLYFALLSHVPPLAVLVQRVVWSVVFLGVVLTLQRRWDEVADVFRTPRRLAWLTVAAVLIAINWYVFIHAVTIGQVLQSSLGYYINPLVNVLLGLVVLRERLRLGQWVSVAIAAGAVAVLASEADQFPWIALTLALSFGLYGLLRKLVPVGPMIGLLVETSLLLPFALALLGFTTIGHPGDVGVATHALLALAGVVTALPLLWFVNAARRLRLSTLGFMQYLGPSLQLIVAVTLLGETLDLRRVIVFGLIWFALAVFSIDTFRAHRAAGRRLMGQAPN